MDSKTFINKKNVTFYPFSCDTMPLVNYLAEFCPEYQIRHLVSPQGLGLTEKNAAVADNRLPMDFVVCDDLTAALSQDDVLLIAEGDLENPAARNPLDVMQAAVNCKKEILCTAELTPETLAEIRKQSKENKIGFHYAVYDEWNHKYLNEIKMKYDPKEFYTPTANVLFVGQLTKYSNTFEVFLMLSQQLRKAGYRVTAVGDKKYCELLGLHSLPSFLRGTNDCETDKIVYFNHYIQYLDQKEHPDFIIVQIPEGIMRYSHEIPNGFGVYAYLISQAVQPDFFICTMPYQISNEYFNSISEGVENRLGFGIDAIHISNIIPDRIEMNEQLALSMIHVEEAEVDKQIESIRNSGKIEIPIYDLLNQRDQNQVVDELITATQTRELCSIL